MLKKRLIGTVVVRSGIAVQSYGFQRYLPIGRPEIVVEALDTWGVDEIAVVDISAARDRRSNIELVRSLSRFCQVPLTYGGGITTSADMTAIVQAGADKVMINQAFRSDPEVVAEGAALLGSQCLVVSMDVVRGEDGALRVYDYSRHAATEQDPVALAARIEGGGAGELFLNFVHRDGSRAGYDMDAVRRIAANIRIPLTVCGGVGHVKHFAEGLDVARVSAVAAANYFNFTEHSVTLAKRSLKQLFGHQLRCDTYFNYADSSFCESGRLAKKEDDVLRHLLFESHPREVI